MYLTWNQKTITDFSEQNINSLYSEGYLFGRTGHGEMYQTRSLRINLSKLELSSENRRILKKTEGLQIEKYSLPYKNYHWSIGKLAKDFYDIKFGDRTFSANKIKELMTDREKSNFNTLLVYTVGLPAAASAKAGYCISLETTEIFHYCYPFYQLTNNQLPITNTGLGMMLRAILYAQEHGKKYLYLGSAQRPSDTYKLQFAGLEWWDGEGWKRDLEGLKKLLTNNNSLGDEK